MNRNINNDKYTITQQERPLFYNRKAIVAGNQIEAYSYHSTQVGKRDTNTGGHTKENNDMLTNNKQSVDRKQEYLNKSRRELKRLINANLHQGTNQDKFLTLTFADNVIDKQFCLLKYRSFLKSLQRSYGDIKYITILEKQKRGAFHFHIVLFDFPYIDLNILNNKWKHGYTDIQAIKNYQYTKKGKTYNFANYLVKYMGKELGGTSIKGERRYYKSNNLKQPITIYDASVTSLLDAIKYHREFNFQFSNQFVGDVDYEKIIAHDKIDINRVDS